MKNRQGAKKLYKAHKTWIAAGLAAATLFSVQALGTQTVAAADIAPFTETDAKTELLNVIANNKDHFAQQGIGNVTDTVTGKSFYGDFDALKAQVENGTITSKTQLFAALKPVMEGFKEYAKEQAKKQVAAVGNQIYTPTGRTYFGQIDYLFNNAKVTADDDSTDLNLDYSAVQTVMDAAKAAATKTIKIDLINPVNHDVLAQLSYTVDKNAGVPMAEVSQYMEKNLPGYTIDESRSYKQDGKYYVAITKSKTINVDLVDEDSLVVMKQLSYTVDEGTGVPLDQVEAELPAGYRIDKTKGYQDPKTGKYHVAIYNVAAAEKKAKDAVSQLAAAAKAATKTIKINYVDINTKKTVKETAFIVGKNAHLSIEQGTSQAPEGYTIDWNHSKLENGIYEIAVYKTVTNPGNPAPKPTVKKTSTQTTTATKTTTKKATKTLPKTGDTTNTVASSIGVVSVIGALFGLAGTTKKRA